MLIRLLFFTSLLYSLSKADDDTKDVGTVIGIDLGTTYSWYVIENFFYIFLIIGLLSSGLHAFLCCALKQPLVITLN